MAGIGPLQGTTPSKTRGPWIRAQIAQPVISQRRSLGPKKAKGLPEVTEQGHGSQAWDQVLWTAMVLHG